jgi:hypothetical protein
LKDQDQLSKEFFRLAPDPNAIKSFKALVKHNVSQRGPPQGKQNMLFKYNIGSCAQISGPLY